MKGFSLKFGEIKSPLIKVETLKRVIHRKHIDTLNLLLYHAVMDNNIIWAAGFLDGEGTFTIKRVRYIRNKSKLYYQPYISCAQTIRGIKAIERLRQLFGGHIYRYHEKRNRFDTVTWATVSRDSEQVIKMLLPHLLLKKKQAKILLEFYDLMEPRYKNYRLRDEDYDLREKLYWKLRKFNVKGGVYLKRLSEETPKGDATV